MKFFFFEFFFKFSYNWTDVSFQTFETFWTRETYQTLNKIIFYSWERIIFSMNITFQAW